jgi:formiminotetrahydrofolate cyclodeaminase
MQLGKLSVREFADAVAADSPAPGGGCVAALAASLAASLVAMVCGLTIGKAAYAGVQAEMVDTLAAANGLKEELLQAMEEDWTAFQNVLAAYRLPKEHEPERQARRAAIQEALQGATLVPLGVAEKASAVQNLARVVAEKGNRNASSDAGVAMEMAKAAAEGALLNIQINLAGIKDEEFVATVRQRLSECGLSVSV